MTDIARDEALFFYQIALIFLISPGKKICCGYTLDAPCGGAYN